MANSAFSVATPLTLIGTSNEITVTNSTYSGSIGLSPTYAGQASITTLGTITAGTWSGSPVLVAGGGSASASFNTYGVLVAGTTSVGALTTFASLGTSGQNLVSNGAAAYPTWQTTSGGTVESFGITSSNFVITGSPIISASAIDIELPASIYAPTLLINGDFQVWQAGTSFSITSSITYGPDRWQVGSVSTVAMTFSQVAGATSGSYLLKCQRNSGTSGVGPVQICQTIPIDGCVGLAGQTLSLSFKAKCGANFSSPLSNLIAEVISGTGSSDVSAFSTGFSGASTHTSSFAINSTLTQYSFANLSVGSSVTQLAVTFYYPPLGTAGTDDSFSIADVKLELGPTATPFDRQSLAQMLPQCYRFRYRPTMTTGSSVGNAAMFGQGFFYNFPTSNTGLVMVPFSVPMRAIPSIGLDSTGNYGIYWSATPIISQCTSIVDIDVNQYSASFVVQSSGNTFSLGFGCGLVANTSTTTYIDFFADIT